MINRKAIFSDETESFKTPYEPVAGDRVTLKIRTLKNDALKVYAVVNGIRRVMKKLPAERKVTNFDYYSVSFTCTEKPGPRPPPRLRRERSARIRLFVRAGLQGSRLG